MSIINDAAYSSRPKHSSPAANTLANNLLSRKRKRETATPSQQSTNTSQVKSKSAPGLQQSVSESFIQTFGDKASLSHHVGPSVPDTIIIKSSDHDNAINFRIISTIPRSSIPLTYIDSSTHHSRLFTARIPQLAASNPVIPLLLIVRAEERSDEALHAIERVGERAYALNRLSSQLGESDIQALASGSTINRSIFHSEQHSVSGSGDGTPNNWWQPMAVVPSPDHASTPRKAPRLSFCRMDAQQVELKSRSEAQPEPARLAETLVESVEDVSSRFISQYLDTLYLSKTPLGFFTKGPLSRIRAAFTGGQVQDSTASDLVAFLRTMVLSSSTADKKYKDKFPELLKELPSQQDVMDKSPVAKKKRRKKKLKPDKQGMLAEESDYFARWWFSDEGSAPSDETAAQSLRRRSDQLRTRETFMQVILVLEVLALEGLPDVKAATEAAAAKTKSKKGDQLALSLELLVDKLCIWRSLSSVDALVETPKPDKTPKDGANQLRSFCIEVIIPFYMSRIPEHAHTVNKKLGGPSTSSKVKPSTAATINSHNKSLDSDKKSRRSLQRVATETQHSQSASSKPARSFTRSATDSQLPSIKREDSNVSLSSIPNARRDSQSTTSLQKHRLREREVDFGALAAANEAKAKRKQEVDAKLRDAISTLKKPSRAVVSGEFADVLDQRKKMAEARARPPMAKRGSSSTMRTQVTATPKQGNKNSTVAATPHHIPAPSFTRPAAPPSSGPNLVPSSSIRPKSQSLAHFPSVHEEDSEEDGDIIPATDHRPRHHDALAETPSKPKVNFSSLPRSDSPDLHDLDEERRGLHERDRDVESPLRESPSLLKTPSKPTKTFISMTPSRTNLASTLKLAKSKGKDTVRTEGFKDISTVAGTPKKSAPVAIAGKDGGEGTQAEGGDIYDMLGWNDDFED